MTEQKKSLHLAAPLRILIVFFVAFDLAFIGQKLSGAYESEFGSHPDEAAHCVTGIFVHDAMVAGWDYARGGFHGSPIEVGRSFADEFYLHYPKVALGVWPPAFHTVQAAWTFPFGISRFSLLLLMAVLAGATATVIFEVIRRDYGAWAAAVAALVWLCGPLVREHTGMLMAEMLSALTIFSATVFWGKFLEDGRARDAILFALLASAAILTKGTGLALLLMCAISILMTRRWKVLARPALWGAALIVLVLAGIWTWKFRHEGTRVGGWEANEAAWTFTRAAVPFYLKCLVYSVAFAAALFGVIGMATTVRAGARWAVLTSCVVAIVIFQSLVPAGRESRHILAATPALMVLAVAGLYAVARHKGIRVADATLQLKRERLWVLLFALLALPQSLRAWEHKSFEGFRDLADEVLKIAPPGGRVLVCSDASGEGMFISELAMRDERPNLIVERASKSLVDPEARDWAGRSLRERFRDDGALLNYILRSKIEYIVLDAAVPDDKRVGYHDQLRRVIGENAGTFWPVAESPVRRKGEDLFPPLRLYRVARDVQPGDSHKPAR
jgi:hypothetical protein